MKFDFKNALKGSGNAAVDIGLVTAGAIASNQFLDLSKMFTKVDKEHFLIKHQGGVKAGAAILGIGIFGKKMPGWMRMLTIGIGVAGAIKEVKVLTGGKIESIGTNNNGSDTTSLDALLQEAANNSMNGYGGYRDGTNTSVGANDTGAGVGMPPSIPNMDYGSTVGWTDSQWAA